MKALLISIHPQWVELILNFIKKDEIRKGTAIGKAINRLIKEQGVAPMLIYCTKGNKHECLEYADNPNPNKEGKWVITSGYPYANGKVVARFNATAEEIVTVNRLDTGKVILYRGHKDGLTNRELMEGSCLTFKEMNDYLQGEKGTDIHINNLEIFDKPKEISEFVSIKKKRLPPLNDCYHCRYMRIHGDCDKLYRDIPLTKAPQSWCYVEVEK